MPSLFGAAAPPYRGWFPKTNNAPSLCKMLKKKPEKLTINFTWPNKVLLSRPREVHIYRLFFFRYMSM